MDVRTRVTGDAREGGVDAFDLARPLELPPTTERDVRAKPLLDAERAGANTNQ